MKIIEKYPEDWEKVKNEGSSESRYFSFLRESEFG